MRQLERDKTSATLKKPLKPFQSSNQRIVDAAKYETRNQKGFNRVNFGAIDYSAVRQKDFSTLTIEPAKK